MSAMSLRRVAALAALALLLIVWWTSGSFVLSVLVLVLLAGTVGLGIVLVSWAGRPSAVAVDGPEGPGGIVGALPTADLAVPTPTDRARRALRGLLARPWVHGDGLVRAASRRLASEDALVWTPRGQRVAAPHVWVEWHPDDLAAVAARWPLAVLADELLAGYREHARETGARCLADRTWLHLLAGSDVPVGRIVVTAAFSRPQREPVVSTSTTSTAPSSPPAPSYPEGSGAAALPRPRPASARGSAGGPGPGVGGATIMVGRMGDAMRRRLHPDRREPARAGASQTATQTATTAATPAATRAATPAGTRAAPAAAPARRAGGAGRAVSWPSPAPTRRDRWG